MATTNVPAVIIDNGSSVIRAGYPAEVAPRVCIPSIVGVPRNKGVALAAGLREYEVGTAAIEKRGSLDCSWPIRAGHVRQWADMERLWSHVIYKELRITPEQYCFVLTQPVDTTPKQKEATLEVMLETFNAHSIYLGGAPALSLYAYGRTTGVVIDAGLNTTCAVPIHEGYQLGRHVTTTAVAGEALTKYLAKLLDSKGYTFSTLVEMDLVNSVKESMCFVAPKDVKELAAAAPAADSFRLPDGQSIPMDEERYRCPEALFDFSLLGDSFLAKEKVFADAGTLFVPSLPKGLSWTTYAAINNCEPCLKGRLYDNIVMSGGSSLFPGTRERLLHDLTILYRENALRRGAHPDLHLGSSLPSVLRVAGRLHALNN